MGGSATRSPPPVELPWVFRRAGRGVARALRGSRFTGPQLEPVQEQTPPSPAQRSARQPPSPPLARIVRKAAQARDSTLCPAPSENFPIGREARQPMPIGPLHREDGLPLALEVVSLANDRPPRGEAEAPAPAWNIAVAARGSGLPPPGRLLRTFSDCPASKAGNGRRLFPTLRQCCVHHQP